MARYHGEKEFCCRSKTIVAAAAGAYSM